MSTEELKRQLTQYLKKREEANADESAKSELGKVVGGTKGNAVLEYISGAPAREKVIDEIPDIFDYSELAKYGYSNLVTTIMDAGGRREMYSLMGMPVPAIKNRIKPKKVPKLIIDRDGENDQARYSGLKVTQVLDDDEMGRKLEEALKKQKEGKDLRAKLQEESYVQPFADKRNTGPRQTPDWTPERLDEEGKKAGQAMAWARKVRAGEFKKDPYEFLNIEGGLAAYSIITSLLVAFAFGNSTTKMLQLLKLNANEIEGILNLAQGPALAVVLASAASCIFCLTQAPAKNRSVLIWALKGYAGGPLTVGQLRELDSLITRGEADSKANEAK